MSTKSLRQLDINEDINEATRGAGQTFEMTIHWTTDDAVNRTVDWLIYNQIDEAVAVNALLNVLAFLRRPT